MLKGKANRGFTIVELLIVIIVIGILAALVLIAYSNVSDQAKTAAAKEDLEQIAKQINLYKENNAGGSGYPADASSLTYSSGTTLQYSVNNASTPPSYCATATNGNKSYFISNSSQTPTAGGCPGHGVGGVAPITNLNINPDFETNLNGYSANNASSSIAQSSAMAYSGTKSILSTSLNTTNVYNGWKGSLAVTAGKTYTMTGWAYLPAVYGNGVAVTVQGAGLGVLQGNFVTAIGSWGRSSLTFTPTASGTLTTYFITSGGSTVPAGATFYSDAVMITEGTTTYNYGDGDSTNWVWNGTANASTSTGPVL